ncbi:acyltransferase family protein [Mycobacterium sp. 1081908.1]|uniref:acyltransferase family protein n=1 Tax=Mycobacterium sp. 1081908.1 TaxID=1834066 RepID=UPI0008022EF6|nr:acyltransferase family protein [Mycobacterium sp. 1081908.1]OBK45109.1 acyltransferase [Mycobacterium sp. 1081908.1]
MLHADRVSPVDRPRGQRSAESGFRADIEGLRAVAVVAVVLFHAGLPGVGGGFVGVDLFFVISGFLITGLLWREVSSAGTVKLSRFYGARARRLLPASALVGVVTAIASAALLPPLQARGVLEDGVYSALYVSNNHFAHEGLSYFSPAQPPSPFQHYWSLGVEEQFYLVWPALIIGTTWLIRLVRRRTKAEAPSKQTPYLVVLALVAALSFVLSLAATFVAPSVAFFSLPTRAWQLAAGGLVALLAAQLRRLPARAATILGWAGLAVILLSCGLLGPGTLYPGTAALLPVLGAVLVIGAGCATPAQGCGRVLGAAPMRAIGRISYSLYLWHWPVLLLAPALLGHPLGLAGRLAMVLVSGALAVLTLRFIEDPFRFAAPIRRSALASLALGGVATAAAVCVGVALIGRVPDPVGGGAPGARLAITASPAPAGSSIDAYDAAVHDSFAQVQAAVAAAANLRAVPSNLEPPLAHAAAEYRAEFFNGCQRNLLAVGQPGCVLGDPASKTTVALLGDSHATMWAPAFQQVAEQRHWRLETLTKGACPPMSLPVNGFVGRLVDYVQRCEQWRGAMLARLRAEHPRLVVVSMSRGYGGLDYLPKPYNRAWSDGLTRLVQQLRGVGAQVLVLGPVPNPYESVPICLSDHLDDAMACSSPRSKALNRAGIADETTATKAGGGHYENLTQLFCTADRCPVVVGDTMVYFDDHLTSEYARALAPAMGALADRALAGAAGVPANRTPAG